MFTEWSRLSTFEYEVYKICFFLDTCIRWLKLGRHLERDYLASLWLINQIHHFSEIVLGLMDSVSQLTLGSEVERQVHLILDLHQFVKCLQKNVPWYRYPLCWWWYIYVVLPLMCYFIKIKYYSPTYPAYLQKVPQCPASCRVSLFSVLFIVSAKVMDTPQGHTPLGVDMELAHTDLGGK